MNTPPRLDNEIDNKMRFFRPLRHRRGVHTPQDVRRPEKIALLPIPTKFGQCYDLITSQLQALFQLFSSYPPVGRALSS